MTSVTLQMKSRKRETVQKKEKEREREQDKKEEEAETVARFSISKVREDACEKEKMRNNLSLHRER